MHEHALLVREPGQQKNKVRRTVGEERRYVVDISATLLSEIGPSGPSGPAGDIPSQNQGHMVDRFPAWYWQKPVQAPGEKPVHTSNVQPHESWTDCATAPWSGFETEPVQHNGQQREQNHEGGPEGPEGPESAAYKAQSFLDGAKAREGNEGAPDAGGDWDEGELPCPR